MAQPSISTSRGEKVSRTQAARLLFTANQSPVAVRPVAASTPSERRSATQCSGLQVGNSTWFTVETKPMGSPTAVVSTSCCKKSGGHNQTSGGQVSGTAGHAGVYKQVYAVFQTEDFRAHGGIDLPDTSGTSNDIRLNFKKRYAGKRFKRLADFR